MFILLSAIQCWASTIGRFIIGVSGGAVILFFKKLYPILFVEYTGTGDLVDMKHYY